MIHTRSHTILVLPVISASVSNSLPQTVQRWCFKKCFFKWRDKVEPSVTIPDRTSRLYNKRRCVHSFEYNLGSKFLALRQTWAHEATISLFGSGWLFSCCLHFCLAFESGRFKDTQYNSELLMQKTNIRNSFYHKNFNISTWVDIWNKVRHWIAMRKRAYPLIHLCRRLFATQK